MNRQKTLLITIMLVALPVKALALELGKYHQREPGKSAGNIDINLVAADQPLNVQIQGIEDYDLVQIPEGARIVIGDENTQVREFAVIARYGIQEKQRSYKVSFKQPARKPGRTYEVKEGESITQVAEQLKGQIGGTFHQRVIALVSANTGAFLNDDINQLKEQINLVVPTREAVASTDDKRALVAYRKLIYKDSTPERKSVSSAPATLERGTVFSIPPTPVSEAVDYHFEELDQMIQDMKDLLAYIDTGNPVPANSTPGE